LRGRRRITGDAHFAAGQAAAPTRTLQERTRRRHAATLPSPPHASDDVSRHRLPQRRQATPVDNMVSASFSFGERSLDTEGPAAPCATDIYGDWRLAGQDIRGQHCRFHSVKAFFKQGIWLTDCWEGGGREEGAQGSCMPVPHTQHETSSLIIARQATRRAGRKHAHAAPSTTFASI